MVKLGIEIKTKQKPSIMELKEKYDDVILCCGANESTRMGILGENLPNVFGANELLEYENYPSFKCKSVVVIGGGNVAMDMARVAKRHGAKSVTVAYRRARPQMPAEPKEIEDAMSERYRIFIPSKCKAN